MTETTAHKADMPAASKIRCAVYAVIAAAALVATWSQVAAYFEPPATFSSAFFDDVKVTAASRSLTADALLVFLTAAVLMVLEARKHGIRFVWLYILGGFATAISVTFPLFLIAREFRLGKTESPRLGALDTIGLVAFGIVVAALTIWVDAA